MTLAFAGAGNPLRALVALTTSLVALVGLPQSADAKTPGHTYCYKKVCHTVLTLDETRARIGRPVVLNASFYDDPKRDRFNPRLMTSSGELFRPHTPDNAASPIYPDGTKLLVWHPGSRRAVLVRVNNAGPYWGDRKLDLSRAAAERLGMLKTGVARVHVRVLEAPTRAEATYRKGRRYAAVEGYLGEFASLDLAATGLRGPGLAPLGTPGIAIAANAVPESGRAPPSTLATPIAVAALDIDRQPPLTARPQLPTAADAAASRPIAQPRERETPVRLTGRSLGPLPVSAELAALERQSVREVLALLARR